MPCPSSCGFGGWERSRPAPPPALSLGKASPGVQSQEGWDPNPEALQEWRQLTGQIRERFKKKLTERLVEPRIAASKLRGSTDRHKIKLRGANVRLVHEVRNHQLLVLVVALDQGERNAVLSPG